MTEQELKDKIKEAHAEWANTNIGYSVGLADHLLPIIKAHTNAQTVTKDAEIKRLRDGIEEAVDWLNNPDDNVDFDELLQSLLSPAPVTETKNEDQE